MRLAATLALVIAASPVQAVPVTLGCVGTVTTSIVPKDGVAPEPENDFVSEYSLVVDLDQRAIFGFWFEDSKASLFTGAHSPLEITNADANRVYFESRKNDGITDKHIVGGVDRITGAVNADDFTIFSNGDMQRRKWDFDCNPMNPPL
jgi:hypothetical protein